MANMKQMLTDEGCDLSEVEFFHLLSRDYEGEIKSGVDLALIEEDLMREFDHGFGGTEGPAILFYTADEIFFSVCYDGAESVSSVPRNPREGSEPYWVGGW